MKKGKRVQTFWQDDIEKCTKHFFETVSFWRFGVTFGHLIRHTNWWLQEAIWRGNVRIVGKGKDLTIRNSTPAGSDRSYCSLGAWCPLAASHEFFSTIGPMLGQLLRLPSYNWQFYVEIVFV